MNRQASAAQGYKGSPSIVRPGRGQKLPFAELQFIRLGNDWQEFRRDSALIGDASFDRRILSQYQLCHAPYVMLDFWYRGHQVSVQTGNTFRSLLRQSRQVNGDSLGAISEVLGVIGAGIASGDTLIETAEVGSLRGKMVLTVRWEHRKLRRKYLTLLIDADSDGRTVHEIHFSAPSEWFSAHLDTAVECFRSIQWNFLTPPPMSSIA